MKEILTDLLIVAFFVAVSAGVAHHRSGSDRCKAHTHGAAHAQGR